MGRYHMKYEYVYVYSIYVCINILICLLYIDIFSTQYFEKKNVICIYILIYLLYIDTYFDIFST